MLKRLLSRAPRDVTQDIATEITVFCHVTQLDTLSLSPHLRRDLGLDCDDLAADPPR